MRKTEMSAQQLEQRQLIVDTLSKAGWSTPTNENQMFDEGLSVQCEAVMKHVARGATLTMFYRADQDAMYVSFDMPDGRAFELKMKVDVNLAALLQAVTSFQNQVMQTNYRDHLRSLMAITDELYVSVDGDNFVRLTDNTPPERTEESA